MLTQNRRCLSLFWETLFCLFSAQLFLLKHNFSICWNYFDFLLNIYSMLIKSVTVAQKCSVKKVFLKISRNSQENNCVRLQHWCFPVNFLTLLRKPILYNTSKRLLLLKTCILCIKTTKPKF